MSEKQLYNGVQLVTGYTYGAMKEIRTVTYPDGSVVSYEQPDGAGRPQRVTFDAETGDSHLLGHCEVAWV